MCPAPELHEVPVRARYGERGHVGGEPLPAGPQAPQLRHGAAGVGSSTVAYIYQLCPSFN